VGGLVFAAAAVRGAVPEVAAAPAGQLVALGMLLLWGQLLGELGERYRLPRVTGYLAAGIVLGPWALRAVPGETVAALDLFGEVALGLIALTAGGEFTWRVLREGWRLLLGVTVAHLLLVGVGVGALAYAALGAVPLLGPLAPGQRAAAALLVGTIAVAKSPATTIAVIAETRARGPLVDSVLGITILKDIVLVLLFAAALGAARAMAAVGGGGVGGEAVRLLAEIVASLALGGALGIALGLYLGRVGRHPELVVAGIALLAAELGGRTHLEPLLVCLAAGFAARNLFPAAATGFLDALERASLPLYTVFFALVGAGLDLGVLRRAWAAAGALAGVRAALLWAATRLPAAWLGGPPALRRLGWTGFVAQAGLSLGLAGRVAAEFPGFGRPLAALVVAAVVMNQLLGPPLWRWALVASGEARAGR